VIYTANAFHPTNLPVSADRLPIYTGSRALDIY